MIRKACDHCGKSNGETRIGKVEIVIGGYTTKAELCGVCHGELITKVERFINGEGDK